MNHPPGFQRRVKIYHSPTRPFLGAFAGEPFRVLRQGLETSRISGMVLQGPAHDLPFPQVDNRVAVQEYPLYGEREPGDVPAEYLPQSRCL